MKDLIISTLIILLLIFVWVLFDGYSHQTTYALSDIIDEEIIPLVEDENWVVSSSIYDEFESEWKKYKKMSLSFLENDQINEIDLCVARAEKYIEAMDVSNSAGELCSISTQLKLLYQREKISLSNIL